MAAAAILKITKNRYMSATLTDLHEIYHDDAYGVSYTDRLLTIRNF